MPPANNLPDSPNQPEDRYPLELTVCPSCFLVQLRHVVDPNILFGHYLYSSTSGLLHDHFDEMATRLSTMFADADDKLAVDIGSNDGLLLGRLKDHGFSKVMGVESAANQVAVARENAIPTIHGFFSDAAVDEILDTDGHADVVTATNVFAHVDDISSLTANVRRLLKPGGVFVVEVPYLPVMLESGTVDLVYHEHLSYFRIGPLDRFFASMDMEVFRIDRISTHGGSVRVYVQKAQGGRPREASVEEYLAGEHGLHAPGVYEGFGRKVAELVGGFSQEIKELKGQGLSLAGYGSPAKASTLLGFARIDSSLLDYVVDDNPLKQGRYVPGTGIPIVASSTLAERPPDCVVILAWNLADAIIERFDESLREKVTFIIPFSRGRESAPTGRA